MTQFFYLLEFSELFHARPKFKQNLNILKMFSTYAGKKQAILLITIDVINSLACCKTKPFARRSFFCPHVFTVFEARIA